MSQFAIGFVSGVVAIGVAGIVARLLPDTWVRFRVRIGDPAPDEELVAVTWSVPIEIRSPRWRRALMPPLAEYLLVEVKIDEGVWVRSSWDKGDMSESMLRADAAMSVPVVVLTKSATNGSLYAADKFMETKYQITVLHEIRVRVLRRVDMTVGDEVVIPVSVAEGVLSLGKPKREAKNGQP